MSAAAAFVQGRLRLTAARVPDREALVCGSDRPTWSALASRVAAFAARLVERGVAPGDRVVIQLENGVDAVVAILGALEAGAVAVPIHPAARDARVRHVLDATEATMLVTRDESGAAGSPDLRAIRPTTTGPIVGEPLTDAADPGPVPQDRSPDDLAVLLFTSGSEGPPKGVMHSHRSLLAATDSILAYLGIGADDTIASALPLSFGYGLTQLLQAVSTGARLVLERSFAFPIRFLETVAAERATVLPGVPTMFATLLPLASRDAHDLSAVRIVTTAGAAMPPASAIAVSDWLSGASLYLMYGQTECIRASFLPPETLRVRPRSVGRGMPGQRCWLERPEGGPSAPGKIGELVVAGPHVMLGYWRDRQATEAKLRAGARPDERVLRTGDLFRIDAEGWLEYVARRDDVIKSRGEKVPPGEVEAAILDLPEIAGCAVVGVPDPVLGEAVKAFVVPREGHDVDPRRIVRHCLGVLEPWMAPKHVEIVSALPMTDNGKVARATLRSPSA